MQTVAEALAQLNLAFVDADGCGVARPRQRVDRRHDRGGRRGEHQHHREDRCHHQVQDREGQDEEAAQGHEEDRAQGANGKATRTYLTTTVNGVSTTEVVAETITKKVVNKKVLVGTGKLNLARLSEGTRSPSATGGRQHINTRNGLRRPAVQPGDLAPGVVASSSPSTPTRPARPNRSPWPIGCTP
ncbi:MAG: G5 domain-containing protein [Micropruina glycogenica]